MSEGSDIRDPVPPVGASVGCGARARQAARMSCGILTLAKPGVSQAVRLGQQRPADVIRNVRLAREKQPSERVNRMSAKGPSVIN
jgi:hypothetical protein